MKIIYLFFRYFGFVDVTFKDLLLATLFGSAFFIAVMYYLLFIY